MHAAQPRAILGRHDAGGLVFTTSVYRPHVVLERHTHANAYISFVRAGSYTERLGRRSRRCEASTLLCHEPGETHEDRFDAEPVQLLRIEAVDSELLAMPAACTTIDSVRSDRTAFLCHRMLRELQRPDDLTSLALQGLAFELVATLGRTRPEAPRGPEWLSRIDGLLIETFAEPLDLRAMARLVNVHPVHLARTFRRHRGQTIGGRVRELRLRKACRDLAESDASIAEIALASGFTDQSHLARLMRRVMGTTPSRYRAANSVPDR